jgi:hypothetical protein
MSHDCDYTWQDYTYFAFLCVVMLLFCVLLLIMIYRYMRPLQHGGDSNRQAYPPPTMRSAGPRYSNRM